MSKDFLYKLVEDKEVLSQRSDEINVLQESNKTKNIVAALKKTIRDYKDFTSLAAPQLGFPVRIFCIKFSNRDIRVFCNPMITKTEGLHLSREKSSSIPDKEFIVPRSNKIMAMFQNTKGIVEQNVFEGVVAEVFQQNINLLDGILLSDFGLEILPDFDKASKKQQQEVIDWWLNNLKETNSDLKQEIEKDADLLQVKKAIDFMKGVATGEIQLEKVELDKDKKDER